MAAVAEASANSDARAVLFWSDELGSPDAEIVQQVCSSPGDVWHGGLRLGTGALPGIIDFVHPTQMLNRDPPYHIPATSWRLSLRASLITTRALRVLGGPRQDFRTLEAAGLELGHRFLTAGALVRHEPVLLPHSAAPSCVSIPFEDELRFALKRFGKQWSYWALMRAVLTGYVSPLEASRAAWGLRGLEPPASPAAFHGRSGAGGDDMDEPRVTVLVPTIDRYPYLLTLLRQLRQQTVAPLEIIVIDQTPVERRMDLIRPELDELPLRVIIQEEPGQCTSRNAGIVLSSGDYILFLDDDDEVGPTLIEDHLRTLNTFRADVSSGVVEEPGSGPLPTGFQHLRASGVFPAGNTLIRRDVLFDSGLFDLAYDRAARADGDLGTRIYLSGALMVLNPAITLFHHRARPGGLRTHKARVVTHAGSRTRIMTVHLPSASELYLAIRYFTDRQLREKLWLAAFGTFSVRGRVGRSLAKVVVSGLRFPWTLWQLHRSLRAARRMFVEFPKIPVLGGTENHGRRLDGPLVVLLTPAPSLKREQRAEGQGGRLVTGRLEGFRFVFLLGMRVRSGTNYVSQIFSVHPQVQVVPRSHTKGEFRLLSTLGEWRTAFEITRARCFGWEKERIRWSDYAAYLGDSWLRYLVSAHDLQPGVVFLKDPGVAHLSHSYELFPDARMILLTRDGRDNVASCLRASLTIKRAWSRRKRIRRRVSDVTGYALYSHASQWAEAARRVLEFRGSVAAEDHGSQMLQVRYEDIDDRNGTEVRKMFDLAGVDSREDLVEKALNVPIVGSSFYGVDGQETARRPNWTSTPKSEFFRPVGRWQEWGPYAKKLFKWGAGKELVSLGYASDDRW